MNKRTPKIAPAMGSRRFNIAPPATDCRFKGSAAGPSILRILGSSAEASVTWPVAGDLVDGALVVGVLVVGALADVASATGALADGAGAPPSRSINAFKLSENCASIKIHRSRE